MLNLIIYSAHMLLALIKADDLNIIIIMKGATITVMVVSEGDRKTCKIYKRQKRGIRSIMTISE